LSTQILTVIMGFQLKLVPGLSLSMTFLLLVAIFSPISIDSSAAPNPIPILTLSLDPVDQTVTVDHQHSKTVTIDGVCTVEQMQFVSSTVTLTGSVSEDWSINIDPQSIVFENSGSRKFIVTVVVPRGAPDDTIANVIAQGSCKVPLIQPSLAAASSVIKVKNSSPAPAWDVRIIAPADGEVFTTDGLVIFGTASFNLGEITDIEVKVCTAPWMRATGTTQWSIDYDCSFLDDGEHTIYVRARAGEDEVSPTEEIVVTQDRPDPSPAPTGVGPGSGDPPGTQRSTTTYLVFGVILITAVTLGYWSSRRQRRDVRDHATNVY
jgi:hypothetical protein